MDHRKRRKIEHEQGSFGPVDMLELTSGPALALRTEETAARPTSDRKPVVFRVRGPFTESELSESLMRCLGVDCKPRIYSFATQADDDDNVATVAFETAPDRLSDVEERTYHDEDITIDRHFHGLTVLFSPNASDHQLDIIAVCGLGGHAFGSFKERDGAHMWLRDALPKDFPQARIMIYGYDSHIHGSNSFQNLESLASSLRVTIEGIRTSPNALHEKPIIFIAHSLGGLVLKEALIQSGQAKSNLYHRTQGALFFGVPNAGMDITSLLPMAKGQVNEGFLHSLHPESELLRKQSRQFPEVFHSPATTIFCFHETKTSPTAKQSLDGKWQMNGGPVILVGSSSATHCRPWENAAHRVHGLNRDHSGLVKFGTRDPDYNVVRNVLKEMIAKQDTPSKRRLAIPAAEGELTNRCLQDLLLTNPIDEMRRIEGTKDDLLPQCYQWIMSDSQLKEWQQDSSRRLLWLRGDPGKGKTMLMISLVRELQVSWHSSHALTFFFCQNTDPRLNTATAVLRGLLWLLIHEYPSLGQYLHADYEHSGKQLFDGPNAFTALCRIVSEILQDARLPTVYILIDALDECDAGRSDLLRFISRNAADERSKAKWLVSSRNHLDIEEALENDRHGMLSLELNKAHIAKAVEAFIDYKTNELAQKQGYQEKHRNLVHRHLTANADSTFLWVALVCKRLTEVANYKIATELDKLPPGLPQLYGRMLEQLLLGEDSELTAAIIKSVILAKRPLLIEELPTLTALPEELLDDEPSLLGLIKSCGSFTTIREGTVYLIHQSVKDFFAGEDGQKIFEAGMSQEHRNIVDRSLSVLSKKLRKNMCGLNGPGAPPDEKKALQLKHLGYVCCFWVDHLADCVDGDKDDKFLSDEGRVHRFLLRQLLNWIELLALLGQLSSGISSLRRLEEMTKGHAGTSLYSFIHDAVRFVLQCHLAVEQAPLQIYASGLVFAPEKSLVRQAFVRDLPPWIRPLPPVFENWSALLQTLEGHTMDVNSVAFSPDGKQLASGSDDHTVRLWDAATGAELQRLEGHTSWVLSVAFSPDGKQLASASWDRTVRVWDAATGAELQRLEGHISRVRSVAFSPDGKQLASASWDRTVRVWDAATGAELQRLEGHTHAVYSVAFSPDGKQLASASMDQTVRLWDAASGALLHRLDDTNPYQSLHFAFNSPQPSDSTTLSVSRDGSWIRWKDKQLIWLPPGFRPGESVAHGNRVAVGCPSGLVYIVGLITGGL